MSLNIQSIVETNHGLFKQINQSSLFASSSMTRSIEHVRWSVLREFNSSFFFCSSFFFHLVIHLLSDLIRFLSLLNDSCVINSREQFWFHSNHLSFILLRSDKLIYYCSSWTKIRNYRSLSNLRLLASKFWRILQDFSNISWKKILFQQIEHWINDRSTLQSERWRERLQISSNDWKNVEKSTSSSDHL